MFQIVVGDFKGRKKFTWRWKSKRLFGKQQVCWAMQCNGPQSELWFQVLLSFSNHTQPIIFADIFDGSSIVGTDST